MSVSCDSVMVRILLFVVSQWLSLSVSAAQNTSCTIIWDTLQRLDFDTSYSRVPRIIAIEDTLHIRWVNAPVHPPAPDSENGVFYTNSFDNGKTFSTPYQLSPGANPNVMGAIDEGSLAVSGSTIYWVYSAVRYDIPPYWYWMAFRKSTNAGTTWSDSWIINQSNQYNAVAKDSELYIIYGDIDTTGGHNQYVGDCMVSLDYGGSFRTISKYIPIGAGHNRCILSSSVINYLYSDWISFEVAHTRSIDNGYTWAPIDTISSSHGPGAQWPAVAADGIGNLYVVWFDYKYGGVDPWHGSVLFRKSTDEGATWEGEQIITPIPSGTMPYIAVDGGTIAVIWDNFVNDTLDRPMLRMSFNGGRSWGDTMGISPMGGGADVAVNHDYVFCIWTQGLNILLRRGKISGGCSRNGLPHNYALNQNYPNPFNGMTTIGIDLPEIVRHANLMIYNILGQRIATVWDVTNQAAGHYNVRWDGMNQPSGVYFYRFLTEKFSETKKIIILK